MSERAGAVTMKGNPMTLVGEELKAGDTAPAFTLTGNDLSDVSLSDFAGKVLVLSVVPSLDTPVCATQTKKFNEQVAGLGDNVALLTVSRDLPFAQKRFCGAEGIEQAQTASDYKYHTFGQQYGVLLKELGLLARAVFVVGSDGKITYAQYVSEVTDEPDYEGALEAVRAAS